MGKMKFEEKENKKFLKQRGFYTALAVCMLAMGVGTWTAMNKISGPPVTGDITTTTTQAAKEVEKKQTGITVTEPKHTTAAKTEAEKQTTVKPAKKALFVMPVGGTITKKYDEKGLQYSETYRDWRAHLAVDIAAEKGTEVKTAGDGTVKDVYNDPVLGQTVVIDHGNKIVCYYSGLETPTVKKGQTVEVGKVIGAIGIVPGESVEQPHLHFAAQKDGKTVSPIDALQIKLS